MRTLKLYDIQMLTPLGMRYGQMHVESSGERLSGMLSLLGASQPIDGTVKSDGSCEFRGKLITLLNTIEYCAQGMIEQDSIRFSLAGAGRTFHVSGTLREDMTL